MVPGGSCKGRDFKEEEVPLVVVVVPPRKFPAGSVLGGDGLAADGAPRKGGAGGDGLVGATEDDGWVIFWAAGRVECKYAARGSSSSSP